MSTVICDNCETLNPDNVKFCKQCGNRLPALAAEPAIATTAGPAKEHAAPAWSPPPPISSSSRPAAAQMEKRYGALRGIASLCRLLGWIFAGLTVVGGVGGFFFVGLSGSFVTTVGVLIGSLISAAITYIFWRIIGESISVLLDIEENTRQTAFLLQKQ